MKPGGHIVFTLTISGLLYLVFKSSAAFFASLIGGVLIDMDHLLDYYLQEGVSAFRLKSIYLWCSEQKFKFTYLFLHSIELIFLIWCIISLFKLGVAWIAMAVGLTQHLLLDILLNKGKIYSYSYFLSYRISKGFKKEGLLRQTGI